MSYKENQFQNISYPIKSINNENALVYNNVMEGNTIYDEVKINKPIIMPASYDNIDTFLQNLNYNKNVNLIENNNYNNIIYGQSNNITFESNNHNYTNYNYDYNNIYSGNSNENGNNNYYVGSDTNYDYNNLIYNNQNQKDLNINDYQNIINSAPKSTFNENNNYNNENIYSQSSSILNMKEIMSTPYITNVIDDNEIIYSPENNKLESKKIEFAQIKRIRNDNKNNKIIYTAEEGNKEIKNQNPKDIEVKLLKNSNVTFGKVSAGSTDSNNKKNFNNKILNNNTQTFSEYTHTNYKLDNSNTQNNKPVSNNQHIVRPMPAYQKNAQVKKIIDKGNIDSIINKINNDSNKINNNIDNNKKNETQTTNTIKILSPANIDNKPIIENNNEIQYMNQIPKIDLEEDEEKEEENQISPINEQADIQQNNLNENNENINNYKGLRISKSELIIEKDNIKNQFINEKINTNENEEINHNLNQTEATPMRRPLNNYNSISKTPMSQGFHKVKINKKSLSPDNKFFKNIDWNDKFKNFIYNNSRIDNNKSNKTNINVVKLNNTYNLNNQNIEYNNSIKLNNNNNKEPNLFNQVKKLEKSPKNKETKDYNDLNNISEIRKEQNISSDNEQTKKDEENLNFKRKDIVFEDINSDNLNDNNINPKKNIYNCKIKKLNNVNNDEFRDDNFDDNDLSDDDLKINNFYLDESNKNLSKERNKNRNLKKDEISDSTIKRINNDGLDEFDNNFNNHDKFYNKMKKLFDD